MKAFFFFVFVVNFATATTSVFAHFHPAPEKKIPAAEDPVQIQDRLTRAQKDLEDAKQILMSGERVEKNNDTLYRINRGAQFYSGIVGASYVVMEVLAKPLSTFSRNTKLAGGQAPFTDLLSVTATVAAAPGSVVGAFVDRRIPGLNRFTFGQRTLFWLAVFGTTYAIEHFGGGEKTVELTQADYDELKEHITELEVTVGALKGQLRAISNSKKDEDHDHNH